MFPTLSQYNKTIEVEGANAFRTLKNIFFIPARTLPIKIYSFGSGSFAVVFKALENNKEIAIRCFIGTNGDYAERYRKIDTYLKEIKGSWKSNIEFLDNEIQVQDKNYPILKMDWVDGLLLDRYINKNIDNNIKLNELQEQFAKTSQNLEKNKISHGDIQEGNIIISEINGKPKVKLIDYDGMFIPDFEGLKQIERGRSEYQHPNRENFDFDEKIDRFSFWVILCALEALKFDKTLWKEIMQGGFNTLSNMLFCGNDFSNPYNSKLFNHLQNLNQPSLNFYINQIKSSLSTSIIPQISLYEKNALLENKFQELEKIKSDEIENNNINLIKLTSNPSGASVRNKSFENIGKTPININKSKYLNEEIKIIFGTKCESILITDLTKDEYINFEKVIVKPIAMVEPIKIIPPVIEPKNSNLILWIGLLLLFSLIGIAIYVNEMNRINEASTIEEVLPAVEAPIEVDSAAVAIDSVATSTIDTDLEPTSVIDSSASVEVENPVLVNNNIDINEILKSLNGGYLIDNIEEYNYDKNSSKWIFNKITKSGELYINNLNLSFKKSTNNSWQYIQMKYKEFDTKNNCYVFKDNFRQIILIDADLKKVTFFSDLEEPNYTNAYIYHILRKSEFVNPN